VRLQRSRQLAQQRGVAMLVLIRHAFD
jgi:hypothetical protein